jgi:ADP-ribosylglycohydrolase
MSALKRASGCLFGLAIGDALAAPAEFLSFDDIVARFGPNGPDAPSSQVTDDTQMALAVGEALLSAPLPLSVHSLEPAFREAYVRWLNSPENNRAPGMTCIRACTGLAEGRDWQEATDLNSKGCGANMRVAPVGLLSRNHDGVDIRTRGAIAQFQSAMTHAHPTALAAADLTAATIFELARGTSPADLPQVLRDYALSQRNVYHEGWLGVIWENRTFATPGEFIAAGWDECLGSLDKLESALVEIAPGEDPCKYVGEGWVAEEALAAGLLCFLLHPGDAVATVRRASVTGGDSDSIACLAGAFAGAHHGLNAWPQDWVARIEYRDRLRKLGDAWDASWEVIDE